MVLLLKEKTDGHLVKRSLKDPEKFGEIVDRYSDRLFRYLKRISYFSAEDIEDLVQEVFIKVYQNLNGFDQEMKFSTWIYQIAHNHLIDQIRKKKARVQEWKLDDNTSWEIFKSNVDLKAGTEDKDQLEKMKEIINKLDFKYKDVMVLRFIEEKTYEEIMDIVKKPKGTVAALINRGRKIILKEAKKQAILKN